MSRGRGAGHTARTLTGAALAAGAARGAYALLQARPPGGPAAWTRTNHRGEPVTLLEEQARCRRCRAGGRAHPGPPRPGPRQAGSRRRRGGAFGGYDDLAGSGGRRGFRGHLGALAHGEVTTGAVKLGGIGATGLAASALLGGGALDVTVNAGLIAGGANLLNLFDLRPGRAIKVAALAGGLLAAAGRPRGTGDAAAAAGPVQAGLVPAGAVPAGAVLASPVPAATLAAIPLGAALALAGEDLGERAMLGDAGANALGAMLGTAAAAASLPRPGRVALLAGIVALTAASEKVSVTQVIRRTPPLHWLDMLGRPGPAGSPPRRRRRTARIIRGRVGRRGTGTPTDQPAAPGTTASPP